MDKKGQQCLLEAKGINSLGSSQDFLPVGRALREVLGNDQEKTQVCAQNLKSEMSQFTLWLTIAVWSAPLSLQFSVLFLMFYWVGCGKWVAQTHALKVVGIKLTPLQIKVTLLVQP